MDPTCCTPEQMELIGITADQIFKAFVFGFSAVIIPWASAWVIGVAQAVIREA